MSSDKDGGASLTLNAETVSKEVKAAGEREDHSVLMALDSVPNHFDLLQLCKQGILLPHLRKCIFLDYKLAVSKLW